MPKRILCLAFLALAVSVTAAAAAPLKVITWNLHHGRDLDNNNVVDAQARWLASEAPDILLLQETEQFTSYGNFDHVGHLRSELQRLTGRTYYAFWSNDAGAANGRGHGTAILSVFRLSNMQAKALAHGRAVTMATVEVLPSRVIGLFTTHLASWTGYDHHRVTQVAELTYWLTTRGTTVRLIGADWNLTPSSIPLAPMHHFYTDLYKRAQSLNVFYGPEDTRPVYQSNSIVGRIDALFLGKAWPSWMTLRSLEHVNTGLSDHYAIVADFDIR